MNTKKRRQTSEPEKRFFKMSELFGFCLLIQVLLPTIRSQKGLTLSNFAQIGYFASKYSAHPFFCMTNQENEEAAMK
jgi:hypothetical protein